MHNCLMCLSQVVLQLKLLGVGRIDSFPFVTPPSTLALRKAFELLLTLDALQSVIIIHHDILKSKLDMYCMCLKGSKSNCAWSADGILAIGSYFCEPTVKESTL